MRRKARKSMLVLGGGFGGIATVRALHKVLHSCTVIEIALVHQENYCVFQPMLAEVISGTIGLLNPVTPIRDVYPGATLPRRWSGFSSKAFRPPIRRWPWLHVASC